MIINNNSPRTYNTGGSGGQGGPNRRDNNSGCGCSTLFAVGLVLFLAVAVIFVLSSDDLGGDITKSTAAREPLPSGSVNETEYYTDEAGWITDRSELISGLREFYRKTGVQPHVYIAESVKGDTSPTIDEISEYAGELYDRLFDDEGHFLLVFYDNGHGGFMCGYASGRLAKSVMDEEAVSVLSDYLDRYYTSDMSDEEFFSQSFSKTAERIMTVTKSPLPTIAIAVCAVIVVYLLFVWWNKAKEKKRQEDKRTQEILNTPLEKFGDTQVEELAKKYDGDPSDDTPWEK